MSAQIRPRQKKPDPDASVKERVFLAKGFGGVNHLVYQLYEKVVLAEGRNAVEGDPLNELFFKLRGRLSRLHNALDAAAEKRKR